MSPLRIGGYQARRRPRGEPMIVLLASALVAGYLPGALIFRLPILDRHDAPPSTRPSGSSGRWSSARRSRSSSSLVLAAIGHYQWRTVLIADVLIAALAATAGRRLRYDLANRGDWWALAPVALVALALWVFLPPSEYIIGGKDPGVYMNAGVQIAQRGSLVIDDQLVSSLPAETRDLFFPQQRGLPYYSNRFMGFFLVNPDTGSVIDQFPHLYPTAIAIGYDMAGLTGARYTSTACAVMGVLALYFLGREADWQARRRRAPRACWPSTWSRSGTRGFRTPRSSRRYCCSAGFWRWRERTHDDDVFFAPVAGVLLGLLPFARFDGVLAVLLAGVGLAAHWLTGGRVLWAFLRAAVGGADGIRRLPADVAGAYAVLPRIWVSTNRTTLAALAVAGAVRMGRRPSPSTGRRVHPAPRRWLPHALTAVVVALAAYAWFLREPEGKLALHDAYSLRMFSWYVHPAAIAAALAGLAIIAPRVFWRDPSFFAVACGTAIFVFYRIRIVPEHFWVTRRYLPILLPGRLARHRDDAAAAAGGTQVGAGARAAQAGRYALRLAVLALVAWGVLERDRAGPVPRRVRGHHPATRGARVAILAAAIW